MQEEELTLSSGESHEWWRGQECVSRGRRTVVQAGRKFIDSAVVILLFSSVCLRHPPPTPVPITYLFHQLQQVFQESFELLVLDGAVVVL